MERERERERERGVLVLFCCGLSLHLSSRRGLCWAGLDLQRRWIDRSPQSGVSSAESERVYEILVRVVGSLPWATPLQA